MYKEVVNDIEQLLNAQETMSESGGGGGIGSDNVKPLRFKDIRSSTTSDRNLVSK